MNLPVKRPILCPRCHQIVGGNDTECPHCGLQNPGAWWRRTIVTGIASDPAQALKALIYTNIAMFALTLFLTPRGLSLSMNPFYFLTPDLRGLLLMGATGLIPIDQFGRWWTLLSANYLHGGLLHIVFNMLAVQQLWPIATREFGLPRAFIIYTVGGVIGFFISYLAKVTITIGASAAVCGLMGAALYYGKSRGGLYGQIIYKQIGGWVIGLIIFGIIIPGINNWGHAGGILTGIGLGYLLGYEERTEETGFHRLLASVLALATAAVLIYAVGQALFYRFGG
jgi:rhomboid protease GluP